MKKLYNGFSKKDRPEWITMKDIEKYENDMLAMINESFSNILGDDYISFSEFIEKNK